MMFYLLIWITVILLRGNKAKLNLITIDILVSFTLILKKFTL